MISAFDHHSPNKAIMLDAIFSLDAWLQQHGFQPCTEPGSARVAGLRPGISSPGMTDFWYRGSHDSSIPFFLRMSLLPAPALHIVGDIQIEADDEKSYKTLEAHSKDFTNQLKTYMQSLEAKPSA